MVVGLLADALSLSVDRSATIRTDLQDCEFLVIEKDDFDRVLKSLLFDALASKVEKMKKFKLFEQMSDVHLKKIALHLERRVVPPKTRAYFGRNQHGLVGDSLTTSFVLVKRSFGQRRQSSVVHLLSAQGISRNHQTCHRGEGQAGQSAHPSAFGLRASVNPE